MAVRPLIARVNNGRLQLDVKTELPEGAVVELLVDGVKEAGEIELAVAPGAATDGSSEDERAGLHRELAAGVADVEAGRFFTMEQVNAELDELAK